MPNKRIVALLIFLLGGFVAFMLLGPSASQQTAPGTAPEKGTSSALVLIDMQSIDELKARFNQDVGRPRLVLLLSPT